jgi:hypothetical protein
VAKIWLGFFDNGYHLFDIIITGLGSFVQRIANFERKFLGNKKMRNHTQTPNVHFLVERTGVEKLRSRILYCTTLATKQSVPSYDLRKPPVSYPNYTCLIDEYILWLQVAMHDAATMTVSQCKKNLAANS